MQRRKAIIACLLVCLALVAGGAIAGCSSLGLSDPAESARQTELKETQLEIYVQQTLIAAQQSERATFAAAPTQPPAPATPVPPPDTPTLPPPPTSEPAAASPPPDTPTVPPPVTEPSSQQSTADLEEWMKTAHILLYEDMVARLDTIRFFKSTLDDMELAHKDDGNAKGWFRSDVLSTAPDGQPWDLVIIAAEEKTYAEMELFDHALTALNNGASLILETWYLDKAASGRAEPLLDKCGVFYEGNYTKIPPARMVLFPIDPGNPLLTEPNSGISFTDTTSFWWDSTGAVDYDTGDLLRASGSGQAELVLGTNPSQEQRQATLTRCMDGQLILQTFSSHNMSYDTMRPLIENYIYSTLKHRHERISK